MQAATPRTDAPLLSIADVAEYFHVSEDTVRRMIDRGELPVIYLGGQTKGWSTIRIRPETLRRHVSRWEQRGR